MAFAFAASNCFRTLLFSSSATTPRHIPAFAFSLHRFRLYSSRQNVVHILEERGLLDSLTSDALRRPDLPLPPLRVYCGFDPTAQSLHLGNLLGIIVLSWFLRCGHQAVALVGGATGRIGDPSGKSLERPELDPVSLDMNVSSISATIQSILGRVSTPSSVTILNNYDWWKDVKLLDFLREVGRFARVGTMMSKESVRKEARIGSGNELYRVHVPTAPRLRFPPSFPGLWTHISPSPQERWHQVRKSEDGAIWLSPSLLSPYQFYQYFFSISDADVVRFLKILTFLSIDEISQIESEMRSPGYVPNTAQRRLAEEVTRFVHGEEGLEEALKATQALRPGAETKLDWKTIETIAEDVPSISLQQDQVLNLSLLDLSVRTGLLESKSAARRLLKQGGLYLNNNRIDSEAKRIEPNDIVDGKVILLSAGKKNKMIVRVS
ncbi:UNVERIFIED_CONTAM: Tyrosine--tRNA ligase, chloroplastic/mitochondrial [Sesamum calycinum]|uniref:tyrosine--tRNA ligase n=1 Tax=Sesamum calycinum TaxID=2727403 RepID=A0AAW2QXU5_9LAMI